MKSFVMEGPDGYSLDIQCVPDANIFMVKGHSTGTDTKPLQVGFELEWDGQTALQMSSYGKAM